MIVPGSVNPLLLINGGDPLDEYGVIERSIRFNPPDSPRLTMAGVAGGDRTKWTLNFSLKRGSFGAQTVFGVGVDNNNYTRLSISAADELIFESYNAAATSCYKKSSRVFRDPAAHYNIHIEYETAQATAEDRVRIYINGERITAWASSTNPAPAYATGFVCSANQHCFSEIPALSGTAYLGGYLSRPVLIDGRIVSVDTLWVKHQKTGQWRPRNRSVVKAQVDAGGPNSTMPEFLDGSAATALALGKDSSAKGNHWTPVNISVGGDAGCDWVLDTPTNNHSTLSLIDRDPGAGTPLAVTGLSNGGLSLAYNASAWDGYRSTIHVSTGKWYVEVNTTAGGATNALLGVLNSAASPLVEGDVFISVTSGVGGQTLAIALDLDAGQCTTFRNNVQVAVQPIVLGPSYCFRLCVGNGPGCHINFGQRPYTYTPPLGFKSLCTKNLPFPRITPAAVVVTGAGATIRDTLAAARAGWTDYIEIIKRRDAAEGWRWIFSDDPAYYMDSASVAAKAAIPGVGGTSYVGYALRVGAAYGVATGRLVHAAGVADIVTDGLSNTRKMVILKNEAIGTWYVSHPDLTAGKLLYLEQMTAEATDATISAVTASSFTVAGTLAAGTYRWIALAETDTGLKLFKHAANAVASGPFDLLGHTPLLVLLKKQIGAVAANGVVFDAVRDTFNLTNLIVSPNAAAAEIVGTGTSLDIVSNGLKIRGAGLELNYAAGYSYVGLSIAATPFRYANAR